MCGIVGILATQSSGFSSDEVKAFTDMLFVDTLRGWDSTGIFSVDNDNDIEILKAAVNGPDFIATSEYKSVMTDSYMRGRILIGHNRAATRGVVVDKNAHPFWVEDNVVLVQNGTWNGCHKHIKDTEVDTEAVAHLVHDKQDNLQEAFDHINAAYALIWYNRGKKTLYVTRNDERPLHIAYLKSGTILFASELSTINFAVGRQNLTVKEKPYSLKENIINKWSFDDKNHLEFDSEEIKESPKSKYRNFYQAWYPAGGYEYDVTDVYPLDRSTVIPTLTGPTVKPNDMTIAFADYVQEGRFPDFEYSFKTAAEAKDAFMAFDNGKEHGIEFLDYLPGNKHSKCQAWYLVGTLLVDETNPLRNILVYVPMLDKTEEEIVEYISTNMFVGKLGPAVMRFIARANNHCITTMASSLKQYEAIEKS